MNFTLQPARAPTRSQRRASLQRRGRRIVGWAAAAFLIGQLTVGAALDYVAQGVRFPELARVRASMDAEASPADIVMLGSSRLLGVDAVLINARLADRSGADAPRVFNAAVAAGDPVASQRLLAEWMQRSGRPRLVLLEIQPESINHCDNWLQEHVLRQLDWPDTIAAAPSLIRNGRSMGLVRARLLPLFLHRYQIRKRLQDHLFDAPSVPAAAAYTRLHLDLDADPPPPPVTPEFVAKTQSATDAVRKMVRDFFPNGFTAKRLEQTLSLCRTQNIEVVLVINPLCVSHRNGYDDVANSRLRTYLDELQAEFGACCVDFRGRLGDEYFSDSNHLNVAGCRAFARMLTDEIILPRCHSPTSPFPEYDRHRPALTTERARPSSSR
jgi:hypothetical protein